MPYVAYIGGASAPAPESSVLALLQFDAWPLVDEISPNVVDVSILDPALTYESDLVETPTIGGSASALGLTDLDTPRDIGLLSSPSPEDAGGAVTGDACTFEFYVRRDGSTELGSSIGWGVFVQSSFSNFDYEGDFNYLNVYVALSNTSGEPYWGQAQIQVQIYGTTHGPEPFPGAGLPSQFFTLPYDLPDSEYVHCACVVDDMNIRVYAGGAKVIDEALTWTGFPPNQKFGSLQVQGGNYTSETAPKYIDSVRVSSGALYDADFTPPTTQLAP